MNIPLDVKERLLFLLRVVDKEVVHLDYAAAQVFTRPFTLDSVKQLETDQALALALEAFTSRFCRLQDTIGDKLLPAWLGAMGEKTSVLLINLDKAEKLSLLASADTWIMLRQLRNQMVHEYIEQPDILFNAIQVAYQHLNFVKDFAVRLKQAILDTLQ
jgi:hypothetical protein